MALAAYLVRKQRGAALAFAAAALVYFGGGLVLTMAVNVPMNEALAELPVPQDKAQAAEIWQAYSPKWQVWNIARTIASALAFLLGCTGLILAAKAPA